MNSLKTHITSTTIFKMIFIKLIKLAVLTKITVEFTFVYYKPYK